MNLASFRPANDYASKNGAKTLVYGAPGTGKTPITNTAPRPMLLCVEPGMLSMRGSNVPTFVAPTAKLIDDFFAWLKSSNETRNFDTVCVDSLSEMASVYLREALGKGSRSGNKAHGQAAYGSMADAMVPHLNDLFHMPLKHTYLICKQDIFDGVMRPAFPGKFLPTYVPHLYDVILHLGIQNIPGAGQYKAFRTAASTDAVARDRSGKLNEFEPTDLTQLFAKVMG